MAVSPWPTGGFSCPPFNARDPRVPDDVTRFYVDGAMVFVDSLACVDIYDPLTDGQCKGFFDGRAIVVESRHGGKVPASIVRKAAAALSEQFTATLAPARYLVPRLSGEV